MKQDRLSDRKHWGKFISGLIQACLLMAFTAAFLHVQKVSAATGPLRLSGTFIQYWDEINNWSPATWHSVLDSMKAAKIDTIIIQMLVTENSDGSLHSYIKPSGSDSTETILNYADTNGFKVFLGLYASNWNHDMLGSEYLNQTRVRMATVAQQAWDRYLSGNRHSSFAGWYIPYEPWTANYTQDQVDRLRSFLRGIDAACQAVAGDKPITISPFISASRPSPCRVEELYSQILNGSGLDILLLQDSVGAQQWNMEIPQRVGPYFEAFQRACNSAGVKLWANLESFQITNSVGGPCSAERLRNQFIGAAPYVEDFVTFDFVHYMNPVAFLSNWNQTRRSQMQQLYADYKSRFVDSDYAPFARPIISASSGEGILNLRWQGLPDDRFQLQVKTNLNDSVWTPMATSIATNGPEFVVSEEIHSVPSTRWYSVRKLPRLHLPDSMIYAPPGTFMMGTPPGDDFRTPGEISQFQATLSTGFWINRYEVSQAEYQNLMCTNPASNTSNLENPVDNITWRKAMDYCALLTLREREAMRLPEDYAYRLPTEAEWEYAARAGTTTSFSFGGDKSALTNYAWYDINSGSAYHPVGQLQSNPWGLRDVHGNVFEWCLDWIDSAPTGQVTNLVGSTNGVYHAIRGGAAQFPWYDCRSCWRIGYSAISSPIGVGFRVVLAPERK